MEKQPLAVQELAPDEWVHFKLDELPEGEDWVDIAVQPLTVEAYYGRVIGRGTNAVDRDRLVHEVPTGYSEQLIGSETASIGLFHYYGGGDRHIEPIPRYGRFLHVPRLPVDGAQGKMRAYLVESLASEGMSGSPVFIAGDVYGARDPLLVGLHVGHATGFADTGHAGVSLIAPSWKLAALLDTERLRSDRKAVEETFVRSPWRFRDRRFRLRQGVAYKETHYQDYPDYIEEHPLRHEYLIAHVSEDAQDPDIYAVEDYWNEWALAAPLGGVERVKRALGVDFSSVRWRERHRDIKGWGEWKDGSEASVSLHLDARGAVQVVVLELEHELDYSHLDALTARLRGNHYLIAMRDEVNWIPGPR